MGCSMSEILGVSLSVPEGMSYESNSVQIAVWKYLMKVLC